jgi:glyoxylase-like metal-dependent hydrolase (beta-lactamase superfamily II)
MTTETAQLIVAENSTPVGAILTHGHFDHLNGIPQLTNVLGSLDVFLDDRDQSLIKQNRLLQFVTQSKSKPFELLNWTDWRGSEFSEISAEFGLKVIEAPGHTPGSICILFENSLFSGDTILANASGPVMLPGGNKKEMLSTLHKIEALEEFDLIYPGHGLPFDRTSVDWSIRD